METPARRLSSAHQGTSQSSRVSEWSRAEVAVLSAILLLAFVLRLGAAIAVASPLESDYLGYWQLSQSMADGRGLILPDGKPTAWLSIGYPIFLSPFFMLFGPSVALVKTVNVALGVCSVLLGYLAARRMFQAPRIAALGALIFAVYLEACVYGTYVAKENLMVFLLMAQLALAAHAGVSPAWNPALFGAATGWLAVSGNSALSFMPGLLAVAYFALGRVPAMLRYCVIAGIAGALTIAPVILRNHLVFGGYGLNNNGGFNLYLGNNPSSTAYFVGIERTPVGPRWQAMLDELGEREASKHLGELAVQHILDNPGQTALLALRKGIIFWKPPVHSGKTQESRFEGLFRLIWLLQYVGIALLCFVAVLRLREHWRPILAILLMTAGYTAVHMLFYVIYRYRLPILPMLCLLAGLGADTVIGLRSRLARQSGRVTAQDPSRPPDPALATPSPAGTCRKMGSPGRRGPCHSPPRHPSGR